MLSYPFITLVASLIILFAFSCNAVGSGILHQQKGVFKNWIINLIAFLLAIYLTWINFKIYINDFWPFGIIISIISIVALIIVAAPFYLYSIFFLSYNIYATLTGFDRGPKHMPKVEAMILNHEYDKALRQCRSVEERYPNNLYIKRLLLKIFKAMGREEDMMAKMRTICLYTESQKESLEMVELAREIDPGFGEKLNKTYDRRVEEKEFTEGK